MLWELIIWDTCSHMIFANQQPLSPSLWISVGREEGGDSDNIGWLASSLLLCNTPLVLLQWGLQYLILALSLSIFIVCHRHYLITLLTYTSSLGVSTIPPITVYVLWEPTSVPEKADLLNCYFSECFNRSQPPLNSDCYQVLVPENCPHDLWIWCGVENLYSACDKLETNSSPELLCFCRTGGQQQRLATAKFTQLSPPPRHTGARPRDSHFSAQKRATMNKIFARDFFICNVPKMQYHNVWFPK